MCRALVGPLFKITTIYLKETLTGISQGYAVLRICCGNTHEVTCDIILSSPISSPPPQCMCPAAYAWDVTRVLLSTFQSLVPASWRPLSSLHHSGFRVWLLDTLLECFIRSCFCPLMSKGIGDRSFFCSLAKHR